MRTRGLAVLLAALLAVPAGTTASDPGNPEEIETLGQAGETFANVTGPVDAIVAPTGAAPAFHLQGETFRIEVALDARPVDPVGEKPLVAHLVPSFGGGEPHSLTLAPLGTQPSKLWEGPYQRQVHAFEAEVPADLTPGLYDVEVPELGDRARRALSVHEAWPDRPTVVLIADSQTGDPRAVRDGMEGSFGIDPLAPGSADPRVPPDPGPLNRSLNRTFGVDVVNLDVDPSERWGAYRAAIERVNRIDPDLVLFSGDLTFGQLLPGSYHVEYEEAWALINGGTGVDGTPYQGIRAPTLLAPGNHDGYVQSGEDGIGFWKAYFGPPAFSVTFGNATFLALNTYDWSHLDRTGASFAVSAWGGQVRDDQLSWLRAELCRANGGTVTQDPQALLGVGCEDREDRRVVTFSHHSPSWVQDPWPSQYQGACLMLPCQGTPIVEQFTRGFISFTTTGQAWSGDNRLPLRDTLREFDVDLHAAGHTHRDRVARDLGDGRIVETPQQPRENLSSTQLHLVTRHGEAREIAFEEGRDLLRNGSGPLYLETTTTASETDEYFGFREVTIHPGPNAFPEGARGIPPFETGFAMTSPLLDQLAREPGNWNASHAQLGLFSTPTFLDDGE